MEHLEEVVIHGQVMIVPLLHNLARPGLSAFLTLSKDRICLNLADWIPRGPVQELLLARRQPQGPEVNSWIPWTSTER